MFDSIPPQFKHGIAGVEPVLKTVPHPTIPDVYTLGECLTEQYPSIVGGTGDVQSRVMLYYGSFLELARGDDDWDWEGELWETISHEVRHHLEHLASEDALEEIDFAADQNFARREGDPFDPFFFRSGEQVAPDAYRVEGDVFIERSFDDVEFQRMSSLAVTWDGQEIELSRPAELGDVHFTLVEGLEPERGRDLYVVLIRRRTALDSLRSLFGRTRLRVLESTVTPL